MIDIEKLAIESEPVAWMSSSGSVVGRAYKIRRTDDEMSNEWWDKYFKDYTIPLYPHPPADKDAAQVNHNIKC